MVRSRDVVYPPEGSGTSAVETWFNRLNQRLQALAMTSGNAWEPGGRDTPRPDMYQLYRAADRTSPPAPVIAQAGGTRGLKPIVRPGTGRHLSAERLDLPRVPGERGPARDGGARTTLPRLRGAGTSRLPRPWRRRAHAPGQGGEQALGCGDPLQPIAQAIRAAGPSGPGACAEESVNNVPGQHS